MFQRLTSTNASDKGWVWSGDDVQYTTNKEVILGELSRLKRDKIWVEIRAPGYRSAPTLIMHADINSIEIDKPVDWKQHCEIILSYRKDNSAWHFMRLKVAGETKDSIIGQLPYLFAILERREYYRLVVPTGSQIMFALEQGGFKTNRIYEGLVKDISLGGVGFICSLDDENKPVSPKRYVAPIQLDLLVSAGKPFKTITISMGEIVRVREPGRIARNGHEMAIKFLISEKERDRLTPYIRRRELEILKTKE